MAITWTTCANDHVLGLRPQTRLLKLDEFLKISGRKLLDHAGKISADSAKAKAEQEYDRYRKFLDTQPRLVDVEFEKVAKELKKLSVLKPRKGAKKRA